MMAFGHSKMERSEVNIPFFSPIFHLPELISEVSKENDARDTDLRYDTFHEAMFGGGSFWAFPDEDDIVF